jgi:hypothetical protein
MGAVFAVPPRPSDAPVPRRVAARRARRVGRPLQDEPLDGAVTFLLGAERDGLPADVLDRRRRRLSDPAGVGGRLVERRHGRDRGAVGGARRRRL